MSAATDSRNDAGLGTNLKYDEVVNSYLGPVAAAVNLPTGTVAAKLAADTGTSPVIYPFTASASKQVIGVVDVGGDNTSGVQGAFPVHVRQRTSKMVDLNSGGADAIVATDIFKIAYCADNQTWSKLATDGEAGGMICGIDADGAPIIGVGPMFLALAQGRLGAPFALGQPVQFPVILSGATSGAWMYRMLPKFAGRIVRMAHSVIKVPSTSAKAATFQPYISEVATTGGALVTTSTSLNTIGARAEATTITGSNTFTAGQEIQVGCSAASAVYAEGELLIQLFLAPV